MPGHHGVHAAQVRHHKALKPPSLLEDVGEQERVDVAGHAVDRIVGGHDRLGLAFDDAIAEVRQPIFVKHPFGNSGREARAALLDVVDGVMFERGNQLQVFRVIALQTFDIGHAEAARQIGILPIGLLIAPPVRVSFDVNDGRAIDQPLVLAGKSRVLMPAVVDGARLVGDGGGDLMDQVGIPRRRQRNRHGEQGGRPVPADPMEALVPTVALDAKALHRGSLVIEQHRLLLQRQARDQIPGAFLGRLGGVQVKGFLSGLSRLNRVSQRREQRYRHH